MKILKPGKVKMMKFVCEKCGCIFVASPADKCYEYPEHVKCPQEGCDWYVMEVTAEPYEEPTQNTDADAEKIVAIVQQWLRDDRTTSLWKLADKLIANGVTFREG